MAVAIVELSSSSEGDEGARNTRARTTAEVSEWAIQMTVSQPILVTSERIVALRDVRGSGWVSWLQEEGGRSRKERERGLTG